MLSVVIWNDARFTIKDDVAKQCGPLGDFAQYRSHAIHTRLVLRGSPISCHADPASEEQAIPLPEITPDSRLRLSSLLITWT